MKAYVFTDKALQRHAGQFVWLSLDVEKGQNAPYKKKYGIDALPMYFVVDPKTEKIALRWVGGATVPQLQKILGDGLTAVKGGGRGVEEVLARADRYYADAEYGKAAADYKEALRLAPRNWARTARATESLLYAQYQTKDWAGCAKTARDAWPRLRRTSSAANVAASGLSCALEIPAEDALRAELVKSLAAAARGILATPRKDIAADDVSAVYETLAAEREAAKDEEGKKEVLRARAAFLEAAAAKAKTPDARAVFDSHRLGTYLDLGEPERAVPMLRASERDLPDDYNPPARLALAYKAMKKYDEALAASDRALAKAYGPRKLGILQTRADIYKEKGDSAAARKTIEEAVKVAESLPEGQRSERTIASLKKKLETLPQ
ncbi:MAG TPA: tetratricopeptide repeat protein [Thermoanaerobaculia bacterium]|nr:tetratricopeptide repeat protein [Thermoanaerobaculia bacterium]